MPGSGGFAGAAFAGRTRGWLDRPCSTIGCPDGRAAPPGRASTPVETASAGDERQSLVGAALSGSDRENPRVGPRGRAGSGLGSPPGRQQDVSGRTDPGTRRRRSTRLRRELSAGGAGQDRGARAPALEPRAGVALHRTDPVEQDAPDRRVVRLGPVGGRRENRTAALGTAAGRSPADRDLPAGERLRRGQQERVRSGAGRRAGAGGGATAATAAARADGDTGSDDRRRASGPAVR